MLWYKTINWTLKRAATWARPRHNWRITFVGRKDVGFRYFGSKLTAVFTIFIYKMFLIWQINFVRYKLIYNFIYYIQQGKITLKIKFCVYLYDQNAACWYLQLRRLIPGPQKNWSKIFKKYLRLILKMLTVVPSPKILW